RRSVDGVGFARILGELGRRDGRYRRQAVDGAVRERGQGMVEVGEECEGDGRDVRFAAVVAAPGVQGVARRYAALVAGDRADLVGAGADRLDVVAAEYELIVGYVAPDGFGQDADGGVR